jgi:hypothetical protein
MIGMSTGVGPGHNPLGCPVQVSVAWDRTEPCSNPHPVVASEYDQMEALASNGHPPDVPLMLAPRRHLDERGWFCETFHEQRLQELGISCHFVQKNQSRSNRKGTLRGLHFQAIRTFR